MGLNSTSPSCRTGGISDSTVGVLVTDAPRAILASSEGTLPAWRSLSSSAHTRFDPPCGDLGEAWARSHASGRCLFEDGGRSGGGGMLVEGLAAAPPKAGTTDDPKGAFGRSETIPTAMLVPPAMVSPSCLPADPSPCHLMGIGLGSTTATLPPWRGLAPELPGVLCLDLADSLESAGEEGGGGGGGARPTSPQSGTLTLQAGHRSKALPCLQESAHSSSRAPTSAPAHTTSTAGEADGEDARRGGAADTGRRTL
mmetsp:Transcript_16006/g.30737  ORF Transcript_16006/g.30737 Transcript_16006/m.30737 type:complete len:255 (-) Transcript_16006:881-1645(-)